MHFHTDLNPNEAYDAWVIMSNLSHKNNETNRSIRIVPVTTPQDLNLRSPASYIHTCSQHQEAKRRRERVQPSSQSINKT
jgi:hypothetical protein